MPFSVSPNNIVDNLRNEELGYGFLSDCGFQKEMDIMKVFMSYPKFKDCFYLWEGNKFIWATDKCNRWLAYVEEFKELIYVLVHFRGMPKQGSGEEHIKHSNQHECVRNMFYLLSKLALVGN